MIELDWGRKYMLSLKLDERDLDALMGHLLTLEGHYKKQITGENGPSHRAQIKLESLVRLRKVVDWSTDFVVLVEE